MKNKLIAGAILAAPLLLSTSCISNFGIQPAGKSVTRQLSIRDFNAITNAGPIDIVYKQGPLSATLTAPEKFLPYIYVTNEDSTLDIRVESKKVMMKGEMRLVISSPALRSLESVGSGDMELSGITSPSLTVDSRGSGDLEFDGIRTGTFILSSLGSGDTGLSRIEADSIRIDFRGSGDIKAKDIRSAHLQSEMMGSGDCSLAAVDINTLAASLRGSGDIKVSGKCGSADINVYGSGEIDTRGLECPALRSAVHHGN